jgi:hypothetical protein
VGFIDFCSITESDLIAVVGKLLSITKRWLIFTCERHFASDLNNAFPDEFIRLGASKSRAPPAIRRSDITAATNGHRAIRRDSAQRCSAGTIPVMEQPQMSLFQ